MKTVLYFFSFLLVIGCTKESSAYSGQIDLDEKKTTFSEAYYYPYKFGTVDASSKFVWERKIYNTQGQLEYYVYRGSWSPTIDYYNQLKTENYTYKNGRLSAMVLDGSSKYYYSYEYDLNGRLEIKYEFNSAGDLVTKWENNYSNDTVPRQMNNYVYVNGQYGEPTKHYYTYLSGSMVKDSIVYPTIAYCLLTRSYDHQKRLQDEYFYNSANKVQTLQVKQRYEYDVKGRVKSFTTFVPTAYKVDYVYMDNSRCDSIKVTRSVNSNNTVFEPVGVIKYKYYNM